METSKRKVVDHHDVLQRIPLEFSYSEIKNYAMNDFVDVLMDTSEK